MDCQLVFPQIFSCINETTLNMCSMIFSKMRTLILRNNMYGESFSIFNYFSFPPYPFTLVCLAPTWFGSNFSSDSHLLLIAAGVLYRCVTQEDSCLTDKKLGTRPRKRSVTNHFCRYLESHH